MANLNFNQASCPIRKLLRLELPLCASSDGVTVKINNNHPLELRKFSLKTLK